MKISLTKTLYESVVAVAKYKLRYNYNYLLNDGLWDFSKAKGTKEEEALIKCINEFKNYGIDIKDKQTINLLCCEYTFKGEGTKLDTLCEKRRTKSNIIETESFFSDNKVDETDEEVQVVEDVEDYVEDVDLAYIVQHYIPHKLGYYNPQTKHLLKVNYNFNLFKYVKDGEKIYTDDYGRTLIQTPDYKTYCLNLPFTNSTWTVSTPKGSDKVKFIKNNKCGFYLVVRF